MSSPDAVVPETEAPESVLPASDEADAAAAPTLESAAPEPDTPAVEQTAPGAEEAAPAAGEAAPAVAEATPVADDAAPAVDDAAPAVDDAAPAADDAAPAADDAASAAPDPAARAREQAWAAIEKLKDEDGVVKGPVTEAVKGGLILDIGVRGFLPASLVEMRRVRDLRPYVGRELEAKIIELDKNRNNVVLSRRAWLEQHRTEARTGLFDRLAKGQVRKGVVSSIVAFGAFVDLGGVDGLVHVSELSWRHVDHPSEVVRVGQEVEVEVLEVSQERKRVSLSLKATQEDPWRQFARIHTIGQIVPGQVTKLVPFGAFVQVEHGIEGLVHISELAGGHIESPEQIVQTGDTVLVKIIDIDLDRRRISLSLRQSNESYVDGDENFDPTMYGMAATYDNDGNYIYPEGFDAETGEWLDGFDEQRETWEQQYSDARERWEAHGRQVLASREAGHA
ncbi:S1 RNA-binding domain-containing protein [Paractinoplanes ferrugineus]|nr:S1 RNA-binding domain-containing protein [Actinoplanes ferrugineus]